MTAGLLISTAVHTAISLVQPRRRDGWTGVVLAAAWATTVTGFPPLKG